MNYWFVIANPDNEESWDWTNSCKIGRMVRWTYEGRIKKNFGKVKKGDLVFGYNAGVQRAVVTIARITKEIDKEGKYIGITKIKNLINPISIEQIKNSKLLNKKFSHDVVLNTTVLPLNDDEFDELLRLI